MLCRLSGSELWRGPNWLGPAANWRSPHCQTGLEKVAGDVRTITFVSVSGLCILWASQHNRDLDPRWIFISPYPPWSGLYLILISNASFLFLKLLAQVTPSLLGVGACCHCLLDFSISLNCLKGCLTRILKSYITVISPVLLFLLLLTWKEL